MPDRPMPAYDDGFFARTQAQADALRHLTPSSIGDRVDLEHVAEEIADLGRRDLREVESYPVGSSSIF